MTGTDAAGRPLGPYAAAISETAVAMRDGVELGTTVYRPAGLAAAPTVLIRTPYGRAHQAEEGTFWASQGYNAVVQDTRSTVSYFDEAADGSDTLTWVQRAEWSDGRIGLAGASYLAFAALAIASTRAADVAALSMQIYSADRTSAWHPGGGLNLDLALTWSVLQETAPVAPVEEGEAVTVPALTPDAFLHLPLGEADVALTGAPMPFFRERLRHEPGDPHWEPLDFTGVLAASGLPTLLVDGWFDYHRTHLFRDFERLGDAGVPRRLVLGLWAHVTLDRGVVARESLLWFDRHVRGHDVDGAPVPQAADELHVTLTPRGEERSIPRWPAQGIVPRILRPRGDGSLADAPDPDSEAEAVVEWTYDPLDPTPAVGLSAFGDLSVAGPQDNTALERRPDVLAFTTAPLEADLLCLGLVRATLSVTSSLAHADLFARLCDVGPDGISRNVCDGLVRLAGLPTAVRHDVVIDLGPIGHRFGRGHRIRLQVSSGAHPFHARNLGTGEPWLTGLATRTAHQALHVGAGSATALELPVIQG